MRKKSHAKYLDTYSINILKEGIIAIPPRFLADLSQPITDDTVVLLPMGTSAIIYSINGWNKFRNDIWRDKRGDQQELERHRPFFEFLFGLAVNVPINAKGEIRLSHSISKELNFKNKVVPIVGSDNDCIYIVKFEDAPECLEKRALLIKK